MTSNTEEFICKAKEVHRDKYKYEQIIYNSGHTKVNIICPEHGIFSQTPDNHLRGHGCPKCAKVYHPTTEEFITKAQEIHDNTYKYEEVIYKNAKTKIKITCPEHGDFPQIPFHHLLGHGCPKCNNVYRPNTEEFITKAKELHGDKYEYNLVIYKKAKTTVEIICKKHGKFLQTPDNHLHGQGCPKCTNLASRPETAWLDFLKISLRTHHLKIPGKRKQIVDGFDSSTNTVYQF